MDSNVGTILCFDFCATSDEYLLPSSGFHLLVSSGDFTHVIWVTEFCTRFMAICNIYEFAVCRHNKW